MHRSFTVGFLVGAVAISGAVQAESIKVCRPRFAIKDAHFSEVDPSTLQRKWTATVSVDASNCHQQPAGYFAIGFLREKENAMPLEFRKRFVWRAPSVQVGVSFWTDEAPERYWIDSIPSCTCAE